MQSDRRDFLKRVTWVTGVGLIGVQPSLAADHGHSEVSEDTMGVLVDLTLCVGCRLCEHDCKEANGFDPGPVELYDDQSVFNAKRRPAPDAYTVVNAFTDPKDPAQPVYVKTNCFHCNRPACVSACIVGALRKRETGPVTYDAWKCIGCRYCMVACPFQIPAYDYHDAFAPQVRKCSLCHERLKKGEIPACVKACPRETMVFGKRSELLALAKKRMEDNPGKYVEKVYGEHEVGGTSWLYLSSVPFEKLGFLDVPSEAPPALTESIQHSVFKYGIPPLALYGLLGGLMYVTKRRQLAKAETVTDVAQEDTHAMEEVSVSTRVTAPPLSAELGGSVALGDAPESGGWRQWRISDSTGQWSMPGQTRVADHAEHEEEPMPVRRKLLTPGVMVLLGLALAGLFFGLKRFLFGLGAVTNLDQQNPWGLWIGVDVASGVALAAGGFTTAFLAHVLHREKFHAVVRPALLTAMLGYTFVVIGLQADLGRYYNVWHPMFMWQGNSVLFEVGMCVMCYLTVLYLEFAPIVCERLMAQDRFPKVKRWAEIANAKLGRIMFLLVIAGCVLSCLHQSSLGTLLVITPTKLHPLWWTPFLPLLFLLSAIAVGFPMVIWESLVAGKSLKLKPEMNVLGPLARFIPWTLGIYLAVKLGDMIWRGTYTYLADGSLQSLCWLAEVIGGVVIPLVMFLSPRVRRSPRLMLVAATLAVLGVLFNRVNVFIIGYKPPFSTRTYIPSVGEFAVTIGLIATLMLLYRVIVTYFNVISQPKAKVAP
jgi:Ni/Fe-hydrogenase subunit HybB-like protein/Fe-S-cluster-containing dehydrogenase component